MQSYRNLLNLQPEIVSFHVILSHLNVRQFFMRKNKYRYNTDTLAYEQVERNLKRSLLKVLKHVAISALLAVLFMTAYLVFFDTPSDKALRAENARMAADLQAINDSLTIFHSNLESLAKTDNEIYRAIYELDSIPLKLRNSGFGGANRYKKYDGYQYSNVVVEIQKNLDKINQKIAVQKNSFLELEEALELEAKRMRCTPAITPIHPDRLTRYGTDYGYRRNPITGLTHFHKGVDHTAPTGTPIYAAADGVVNFANYRANGYGKHVIINHGIDGLSTLYAHMNTIIVREGEQVVRGQQIGTVGSTGLSLGPHLHYEVHINGQHVSPVNYQIKLSGEQYDELIENANRRLAQK